MEKEGELRVKLGNLQGRMDQIKKQRKALLELIPEHIVKKADELEEQYNEVYREWKETSDQLESLVYG